MFAMASRAYEVLKWDYPVCQQNCKKRQEIEGEAEVTPTSTSTPRRPSLQQQKSDSSARRKIFAEKMGMSVFCDDGDDSDAHFKGFDPDGDGDGDADGDADARKRTKVRRSRRKDNSPFSLRPPKLSSPNQESKSRHSSGKFLTTTEPLNPSH